MEILVEERSMEAALRVLVPQISPGITFEVREFNGKPDLLRKLPSRLRGYRSYLSEMNGAVVVLIDRDTHDCRALKQQLVEAAEAAGVGCESIDQPPVPGSDAIAGGTWEQLERVLQRAGHHSGGLAKARAAADIARHMDIEKNRSRSFQVFRDGLRHLTQEAASAKT